MKIPIFKLFGVIETSRGGTSVSLVNIGKVNNCRSCGKKLIPGFTVLALLLIGAFGAGAFGAVAPQDQKVFPGTMCALLGPVGTSRLDYGAFGQASHTIPPGHPEVERCENDPNGRDCQSLVAICPIVRDRTGRRPRNAQVVVEDQNRVRNIECLFVITTAPGRDTPGENPNVPLEQTFIAPTSPLPSPWDEPRLLRTIDFDQLVFPPALGFPPGFVSLGSFYFQCVMFPGTSIFSYRIDED
jgi:hypothetical protein